MSGKQDKQARKNATESAKEAAEVAFSMIVNVHKNGDISVGGNIPKDPNATVSILSQATAIATQFCINALMKDNQSRILKPNILMPPPGRLHS